MKALKINIVFFMLLLSFLSINCSDEGTSANSEVDQISGEWIWVKSTGGFFPRNEVPDSGFVLKDKYSLNGSFQRHRNDTLIVNAYFSLVKDSNSVLRAIFTDITTYFNYNAASFNYPIQVTIKGDTLVQGAPCCDTFQEWFVRVK